MSALLGKNALIIIPNSQFSGGELYGLRSALKQREVHVVVLSKSGREARGMKQDKFQPDGMVVDWNKQPGVQKKYHAVILIGGKGTQKSLWDDPIVPQILTDHYRAGSVIGAMGSALVVLMRASLVTIEIPLPREDDARKELESLGATCVDIPVTSLGKMVFGQGADSVDAFSQTILDLMEISEVS
jgi:putative intracellular protease/amidase